MVAMFKCEKEGEEFFVIDNIQTLYINPFDTKCIVLLKLVWICLI